MPHKSLLRLLILSQVFCLTVVVATPLLVSLLSETLGRVLYVLVVLSAVGFAMTLRYALAGLE